MVREGSEGLAAERRPDTPANDGFTDSSNRRDALAHEGGWDPYEVWRTRVKAASVKHRQGEEGLPALLAALK
jgi:hypothetical protein